jgi:hypothetical protein
VRLFEIMIFAKTGRSFGSAFVIILDNWSIVFVAVFPGVSSHCKQIGYSVC